MLRSQSASCMRQVAYGGVAVTLIALAMSFWASRSPAQSPLPQATLAPSVRPFQYDFEAEVAAAIRPGNPLFISRRPADVSAQAKTPPVRKSSAPSNSPRIGDPAPITPTPILNPHVSTPERTPSIDPIERGAEPAAPILGPQLTLQHPSGSWHAAPESPPNDRPGDDDREPLQWRPRSQAATHSPEPQESSSADDAARETATTIGGGAVDPSRREGQYVARQQSPLRRSGSPTRSTAAPADIERGDELGAAIKASDDALTPQSDDAADEDDANEMNEPVVDDQLTNDPLADDQITDEPAGDAIQDGSASTRSTGRTSEPTRPQREEIRKLPPLTQQQINLRNKIRRVLKHYYDRPLNSGDRGPWELMHAMLSFEVHSRVLQGGPDGDPITTVGWLCFNQPCRNRTLLYLNDDGDLRVRVGPALQGHQGQLLALLALSRVKSDYPIRVEQKEFTIQDLVETEKLTCYPKTELTFKLIGLQNYLEPDATWVNDQGMTWDFEQLVAEELNQPVRGAACGGMHRLTGIALGVKTRRKAELPITPTFVKAERYVGQYVNYAYRLQNSDGSFSTEWFRGPGKESDLDRRLKTTGHTLEWLLYTGDEQQWNYYRTVRAVNYLANLMWSNRFRDWEAGPLGHAIHSLVLYDRLVFSKYDQEGEHPIASRAAQNRR